MNAETELNNTVNKTPIQFNNFIHCCIDSMILACEWQVISQ